MTILVTGGTGLVGSRLLKRLVDAGVECRALVRSGKELPAGVVPVDGDILDPNSLAKCSDVRRTTPGSPIDPSDQAAKTAAVWAGTAGVTRRTPGGCGGSSP